MTPEQILPTEKYTRKPFDVEAIQVTAENMDAVAEWCKGTVISPTRTVGTDTEPYSKEVVDPTPSKAYIDVPVKWATDDRQKRAVIGDWLLFANNGFKVYTDRAFKKSFALAVNV